MIRVEYIDPNVDLQSQRDIYVPADDGLISYTYTPSSKGTVLLSWKPLLYYDGTYHRLPSVRYKLLLTPDPSA